MKKLLACVALCALLLSVGTVFPAAESLPPVEWAEGRYACGSAEDFEAPGDVIISWTPELTQKIHLTDGDVADWYAAGFSGRAVTPNHMISWVQEGNGMPEGWSMTVFAAADPDYLYLAFDIVDSSFAYATDARAYDGDAIRLGLDIGGLMKNTLDQDVSMVTDPNCILYSFACLSDGAPIQIMRESSDQDGLLAASEDGNLTCVGAAKRTARGWSAEIGLSWQMLTDDYVWKAWDDKTVIYVGSEENIPLTLGLTVGYLNRDETARDITWAASTAQGHTDGNGTPVVNWTPYDNGATLVLPWDHQSDMYVNSDRIRVIGYFPTPEVPETLSDETAVVTVPVQIPESSEAEDPDGTLSPETEDTVLTEGEESLSTAEETQNMEDEVNAILEKYGCATAMRTGGLVALLALMLLAALAITALVLMSRKKK